MSCTGNHASIGIDSMATSTWLNLNDLGRRFGISASHCGRMLEQEGWRDRHGCPTPAALEIGAAEQRAPHSKGRSALWNADLCAAVLERHGHHPVSRAQHVNQWTDLLEAMADGSPSITTSADQMAEELPPDLVDAVNQQLNRRGCPYRVHRQVTQA